VYELRSSRVARIQQRRCRVSRTGRLQDGIAQPREPVLQEIVDSAMLDALRRGFIPKKSRHDKDRHLRPDRSRKVHRSNAIEVRQRIVGQDDLGLAAQRGHEALFVINDRRLRDIASNSQRPENQLGIVRVILNEDKPKPCGGLNRLIHGRSPLAEAPR
jgi:hypothetical protein